MHTALLQKWSQKGKTWWKHRLYKPLAKALQCHSHEKVQVGVSWEKMERGQQQREGLPRRSHGATNSHPLQFKVSMSRAATFLVLSSTTLKRLPVNLTSLLRGFLFWCAICALCWERDLNFKPTFLRCVAGGNSWFAAVQLCLLQAHSPSPSLFFYLSWP